MSLLDSIAANDEVAWRELRALRERAEATPAERFAREIARNVHVSIDVSGSDFSEEVFDAATAALESALESRRADVVGHFGSSAWLESELLPALRYLSRSGDEAVRDVAAAIEDAIVTGDASRVARLAKRRSAA